MTQFVYLHESRIRERTKESNTSQLTTGKIWCIFSKADVTEYEAGLHVIVDSIV